MENETTVTFNTAVELKYGSKSFHIHIKCAPTTDVEIEFASFIL